jgi:TolA-binding protein
MRKNILFLCFLLSSCGAVNQEELNARLAQINRRIEKLEEEQKTIRAQQIKTEERVDALSQNLASLRLEIERLRVEGRTSTPTAYPIKARKYIPTPTRKGRRTTQKGTSSTRTTCPKIPREDKEACRGYFFRLRKGIQVCP